MVRPHRESVVFTLVVTGVSALGALAMLALLAFSGAPGVVLLATLLAFLPVGPVVACFLWLDRYEPEPPHLLASALAWGAFAATSLAILLSVPFMWLPEALQTVVLAPVSEELTKGAFLLLLLWWRRGELDGVLDGIVYAGMVGIGFAFVENILYIAASAVEGAELGLGAGEAMTTTFLVRCVISPFAHSLFTIFIGIGIGIAVNSHTGIGRWGAPIVGYGVAVLTHGLWNGAASLPGLGFFLVYILILAPLFMFAVGGAIWLRSTERRLLTAALNDAAQRGLVPATDIAWLVDLGARRAARRHAHMYGGKPGRAAMETYQQTAVELAYLHHRYLRGTPPPDFAARGEIFVARLTAVRPYIAFPGQVVHPR